MSEDPIRRQYIDGSSYPPGRTGLRGSHLGSFDVAHEIRDGRRFDVGELPVEESYDLVVVGAGISGLASAWFFRERHPDASILLLDNHDDFGGHAKRNEFTVDGRFLLGYGGSEALQSPEALYGPEAKGMLRVLGIDYRRFERYFDTDLYPSLGLSRAVFFAKEAFGEDRLVTGDPMRMVADDIPADRMHERPPEAFIADFPVSDEAKAQLLELYTSTRDPFPALSETETIEHLARTSYREYLQKVWGLSDEAADTFQGRSHDFFAIGIDDVSAFDAMETGYPGLRRNDPHTGSAGGRGDGRAVHLPLPRWERVDRESDRTVADPRGGARRLDGGSRHGPVRLRRSRCRWWSRALAAAGDGGARPQPR